MLISLFLCLIVFAITISGSEISPWIDVYYHVYDGREPGTIIGNIGHDAHLDKKYGENGKGITYTLLSHSNPHIDLFKLDVDDGDFRNVIVLDRDTICMKTEEVCSIILDVSVLGNKRQFTFVKLTLSIIDVNDNAPIFEKDSYIFKINENTLPGTEFVLPSADDMDSSSYGVVSYRLENNPHIFSIKVGNNSDGSYDVRLILNERLDREKNDFHNLKLIAMDGGSPPKFGNTNLKIRVGDANDNQPIFQKDKYKATVAENFPINKTLITVSAIDADFGLNSQIEYFFSENTLEVYGHLFDLDKNSGTIFLKRELDFEISNSYALSVLARDKGPDSIPTIAEVHIYVTDLNDFFPEITVTALSPEGVIEVPENGKPGDLVTYIKVEDQDGGPGGEVDCDLDDKNFLLENFYSNMYKILTTTVFDREQIASYTIKLHCYDHGTPSLESSHSLTVFIADENDHAPKFTVPYINKTMMENNTIGIVLLKIKANDEDIGENGRISYSIEGKDFDKWIEIDENTGTVKTVGPLDYERVTNIQFSIVAKDNGIPVNSAVIPAEIRIMNIDDEPPMFSRQRYEFATFEGQPIGTEIGTIVATDDDSEYIIFYLPSNFNPSNVFDIDASGKITLLQELDREEQEIWSLTIGAKGANGPSSTVSVKINVVDVNDNAPFITFPKDENEYIQVPYGTPASYFITQVKADDHDDGENGKLIYTITSGNIDGYFQIDYLSGVVSTRADLIDPSVDLYQLIINVCDQGLPPKMSMTVLELVINKSLSISVLQELPPLPLTGFFLNKQYILICMSIVTFLLVTLLIFAIVYIKMKQSKDDSNNTDPCLEKTKFDATHQNEPYPEIYSEITHKSKIPIDQEDYYKQFNIDVNLTPDDTAKNKHNAKERNTIPQDQSEIQILDVPFTTFGYEKEKLNTNGPVVGENLEMNNKIWTYMPQKGHIAFVAPQRQSNVTPNNKSNYKTVIPNSPLIITNQIHSPLNPKRPRNDNLEQTEINIFAPQRTPSTSKRPAIKRRYENDISNNTNDMICSNI